MVQPHLPSWVPGQQGGSCAGCLPQRTKTQALSLARRRPMGAQVLVGPLAVLTAPLVSSIPSRAKILGCDGWGPRVPPSIPSSFPGPRAGPGNSLQPVLPCHPLAGLGGPSWRGRQHAALLWPEYPHWVGQCAKASRCQPGFQPRPRGPAGRCKHHPGRRGMHLPRPLF